MAYSFKSLLHLIYPPHCLHCEQKLPHIPPLLCPSCLSLLSVISTEQRCWTCFAELSRSCSRCKERPQVIRRQLAATEHMGPAATLLRHLNAGRQECIAPMAALMAYQWLEQKMPLPDLLIPLPLSWAQIHRHGFDRNLLLARAVGKLFSLPVSTPLKARFDRSHFLTTGQFRSSLHAHPQEPLCERSLLLIAPSLDDALLRSAGSTLQAHFPAAVDALTFSAY